MPDIVSRIRVEAQGADQAAREIRKLKEAYDQVAQSARGISADIGAGRGDPFARATAAGGGALAGGNTPADVEHRENRTRHQRSMQQEREESNRNYNAGIRPAMVTQGLSTAEAAASGRGGAAAGGALSSIGGMLGGPIGMGLLAAGALGMGAQRLADDAYGRFQQMFGSGMAQRLGVGARDTVQEQVEMQRTGLPPQVISGFISAASTSGVNLARSGAQDDARVAMTAAAFLGIDPSAVAGLIGALDRAGVDASGIVRGGGIFSMGERAFGRADAGLFAQSLQGMVASQAGRGIGMSEGAVGSFAVQMAALADIGGMSPQAAAQFSQQLQGRGIQAAGLQSPEDIIAFQAMRASGASVTDTMIAMERDPMAVNQAVVSYLRRATGGDEDLLRMRVQQYLGPGTSMDAVDRFLRTGERIDPHSTAANLGYYGIDDDLQARAAADPQFMRDTQITAAREAKLLENISQQLLDFTTDLTTKLMGLPVGKFLRNSVIWGTPSRGAGVGHGSEVPTGDFSPLGINTDRLETRDLHALNLVIGGMGLTHPGATAVQTPAARIRQEMEQVKAGLMAAYGSSGETIFKSLDAARLSELGDPDKNITNEEFISFLHEFRTWLSEQRQGLVYTDGAWVYSGVNP